VCVLYILLQKRECCIFCKNILAIYELIEIMCIEDCKQYFQVTGGKISTVSCNWLAQFCCLVMQVFHRFQKYVPLSSSCLHCFLLYNFFWSSIRIFFRFLYVTLYILHLTEMQSESVFFNFWNSGARSPSNISFVVLFNHNKITPKFCLKNYRLILMLWT